MIAEFDSKIKGWIPNISHVKKLEDQSGGPLIKLEWCGMQCSGKYGVLTKEDDHSTEKTGASVGQSTYITS